MEPLFPSNVQHANVMDDTLILYAPSTPLTWILPGSLPAAAPPPPRLPGLAIPTASSSRPPGSSSHGPATAVAGPGCRQPAVHATAGSPGAGRAAGGLQQGAAAPPCAVRRGLQVSWPSWCVCLWGGPAAVMHLPGWGGEGGTTSGHQLVLFFSLLPSLASSASLPALL